MAGINMSIINELRPCVVNRKRALFHMMTYSTGGAGVPEAVVECEDGSVCTVPYNKVRFLDSVEKFEEYNWDNIHPVDLMDNDELCRMMDTYIDKFGYPNGMSAYEMYDELHSESEVVRA